MRKIPPIGICASCQQELPIPCKGQCRKCYNHSYFDTHREKSHNQSKSWRENNREQYKESQARWKAANEERVRENARLRQERYRNNHRERIRASMLKWAHESANNKANACSNRRRARKAGLPDTLTAQQWADIKAAFQHKCAYCGKSSQRLTQDHVVPVSKGGATIMANIVPACRSCNSAKGAREPLAPIAPCLL